MMTLRRLGLLSLLALLHLSLWWALDGPWRPGNFVHEVSQRVELRLLPPKRPPPVELKLALPPTSARPRPPAIAAAPSRTITPTAEPLAQAEPEPAPAPPSDAPATEKLINTEATRRALHQATRSPLLSERAATAMGDGPPLAQAEKLGQEIKKHGNGDCLKGEFLGGGAGILSLPFWLLAEARGKCAR
jgi:hypothetical protein